jgi:ATPase subunit of ABC transporter with duplicated ATPase domains
MDSHNVSYTAARKILDEESYLQGTGSVTLIIGATGVGKTTALKKLLSSQTMLPTAVLTAHKEELASFNSSFVGVLKSKEHLQKLATEKKYSQYAIDDLGELLYMIDEPEYLLDSLPQKADLIITLYSSRSMQHESVEDILHRFDALKLSKDSLSQRVKLIKHITMDDRFWGYDRGFRDRVQITDYHL